MKQAIQYSFVVETSRDQAWSFLWNIEAMARCIPGCEEVRVQNEGESYRARLRRHVGPFLIRFDLDIVVAESAPPERIRIVVSGEDKRLRSQLHQSVMVSLQDINSYQCQIDIATDLRLSGMLASLGERLLSGQIQQELDTFVGCVRSALQERSAQSASNAAGTRL